MAPGPLNGRAKQVTAGAGGALVLAVGGGGWTVYQDLEGKLDTVRADQAVDRSMILNLAHRMDALELKIEAVRLAPTGISAETRPRVEALERDVRELRAELRQLERGR